MKLDKAQVQDPLYNNIGNTGTAAPLLMLSAALETAEPGDRILFVSYGDGSDAFILEGAYQIARAELCRQARHSTGEIDQAAVNEAIKRVEEKLSHFQGLKRKATDLVTLAGDIRQQLDNVERDIRTELNNISAVLTPAEELEFH